MKYQLENSFGDKYDLKEPITSSGRKWIVDIQPLSPRVGSQNRVGRSGGVATGDQEYDTRMAVLSFDLATQSDSLFLAEIAKFGNIFRKDKAPHYLNRFLDSNNTSTPDHRTLVVLDKFQHKTTSDGVEKRVEKITINLEMLNTFWEDYSLQTFSQSAMATGGNLVINNTGDLVAFPIFTVKALSAANPRFTLKNSTIPAQVILESLSFTMNKTWTLDFDSKENNFLLEGVESSLAISDGGPFYLLPGNNTITYISDNGNVDLAGSYRRQYFD